MSNYKSFPDFGHEYSEIGLAIQFSGDILAAKDFIQGLYVHGGFHPAWKYERVIELTFEKGLLNSTRDVTEIRKQFREEFVKQDEFGPECTPEDEAKAWLRTFSLDYGY